MKLTIQLIKKHKEIYQNIKSNISHEIITAKKLGYELELIKLDSDYIWVNKTLEILEEIEVELQGESKKKPTT